MSEDIQLERTEIPNHGVRLSANRGGCLVMSLGAMYFSLGVIIIGDVTGVIPNDAPSDNTPPLLGAIVGCAFFAPGAFAICGGMAIVRRAMKAKAFALLHPSEPWLEDYAWDRSGTQDREWLKAVLASCCTFSLALFGVGINWYAFSPIFTAPSDLFFKIVVGPFDMLLLWCAWHTSRRWLEHSKYGTSRLRFETFPFFVGRPLRVTLTNSGRVRLAEHNPRGTIRFIEQRIETRPKRGRKKYREVCYQLYEQACKVEVLRGDDLRGGQAQITCILPEGDFSTSFAGGFPYHYHYWELKISAQGLGVDYEAIFLVPVYADPEAQCDAPPEPLNFGAE